MKNLFSEIITDIRSKKNIELYVVILVCLLLTILDIFGITNFEVLAGAILLVLTLLAYGMLTNRRLHERLNDSVDKFNQKKTVLSSNEFFLQEYLPPSQIFKTNIRQAKEISICGIVQIRTLMTNFEDFEAALRNNTRIRFLLIDPLNEDVVNFAVQRGSTVKSVEEMKKFLEASLNQLRMLKTNVPEGDIEVKLNKFLPPFTIMGFDINVSIGNMFIYIHPFQTPSRTRPGFILTAERDKIWFEYFRQQFNKMWDWDGARSWNPSETDSSP